MHHVQLAHVPCHLGPMITWVRDLVQTHHSPLLTHVFSLGVWTIVKGARKACGWSYHDPSLGRAPTALVSAGLVTNEQKESSLGAKG